MIPTLLQTPAEVLRFNAGALVSRRARSTKLVVTLYDAQDARTGLDPDGGRWVTVCEAHSFLINHETKALALQWLSHPEEWCEVCMGNEPDPTKYKD